MLRQTLDQRRPDKPLVNNDELRILAKHRDRSIAVWAIETLTRRVKKYSASADMNKGNMSK